MLWWRFLFYLTRLRLFSLWNLVFLGFEHAGLCYWWWWADWWNAGLDGWLVVCHEIEVVCMVQSVELAQMHLVLYELRVQRVEFVVILGFLELNSVWYWLLCVRKLTMNIKQCSFAKLRLVWLFLNHSARGNHRNCLLVALNLLFIEMVRYAAVLHDFQDILWGVKMEAWAVGSVVYWFWPSSGLWIPS